VSGEPKKVCNSSKFCGANEVGCAHWSYDMDLDPFCMHPEIVKTNPIGLFTRCAGGVGGLCGPDRLLHQTPFQAAMTSAASAKIPVLPPVTTINFVADPHPLTDAWIADNYPEAEPETIRRQFDALMKQIELSSWKPFPRFPEVMARVVVEKARTLPDRVNGLLAALAGLPEHWRQWQWAADTKQSFGSKYVRVLGDSGAGMGVQYIADTPGGHPEYFGKLAEFIAAANPDTIGMLLAERAEMLKAAEPKAPLPDDFTTHQAVWRNALVIARLQEKNDPDFSDEGYWTHELTAFDNAYLELRKIVAPPPAEPKAPLPRLSAKARIRVTESIEIGRAIGERQLASDVEFLLEVHDRVHGITAS
jgi:hypothetical protein